MVTESVRIQRQVNEEITYVQQAATACHLQQVNLIILWVNELWEREWK